MKTRTEKQDAVQVKFKLACQFLAPLIVFVREGWRKRVVKGKKSRPYNVAMSHLIRNAITGVYPDLSIDYGKVLISDGPLVQVSGCSYVRYEDRIELRFEQSQHDNADDLVTLIAYQVGEYEAACNQRNATRADGQVILHLPEHLKREPLLLYVIICDRNRKVFGRSLYLGESRPA